MVDIGRHFAVLTASLSELQDKDGDGFANVLEDLDGDGIADTGETNWDGYTSLFGIGSGPGLVMFTPLKP